MKRVRALNLKFLSDGLPCVWLCPRKWTVVYRRINFKLFWYFGVYQRGQQCIFTFRGVYLALHLTYTIPMAFGEWSFHIPMVELLQVRHIQAPCEARIFENLSSLIYQSVH